ncbi:hypothetical protein [Micromonospora tarensis]|uniref:Uncharacterized protein n=1 Tax=Micromonospora tarensis TaxID=2806100 RepID=A0ABS1YCP8_9ACTN|nr:hypothetical protein [Micromonospora tarensis]MBM0275169.1 hypothetical protein [Micromonospora tarensis]
MEEIMFRLTRRPRASTAGVRFCDSCAEVSTAEQRARRRFDATRAAHATFGR